MFQQNRNKRKLPQNGKVYLWANLKVSLHLILKRLMFPTYDRTMEGYSPSAFLIKLHRKVQPHKEIRKKEANVCLFSWHDWLWGIS